MGDFVVCVIFRWCVMTPPVWVLGLWACCGGCRTLWVVAGFGDCCMVVLDLAWVWIAWAV